MQPPIEIKSAQEQRRLVALFELMSDRGREMLLEYAEFLAVRHQRPIASLEPLNIPRPETETVVAAIRRLVETFPMLERGALFNETSGLMAQHMMYARPAPEVINQLEVLFQQHYAAFVERRKLDPQ
ncbi:MAG: hypothetical protein HY273_05360 [Gammaproteobacteria bacterium]|nr:hypothetical protein [Gammaproteobacteria bacterium]